MRLVLPGNRSTDGVSVLWEQQSFIPLLNNGSAYFILKPSNLVAWRWGASPSLYQSLASSQNYTSAPSEQSAVRSFFCQVRTKGWTAFWQICHFFGVDQSFQAASVLPAMKFCLLEKSSCSRGLAHVVWSIVLQPGKVQPTNLELILFSSVSFSTLIYFLQRAQTTISSAWQTNSSTKRRRIILLSLLLISIFLGHLPANKW